MVIHGDEVGLVHPITRGKDRGRFHWESYLAIASKEGIADTEAGALYEIGYKVVQTKTGG
jgi:hypothetical protein